MESKVIFVALMVFSLALSTLAQYQAGKTALLLLRGGHAGPGSLDGSLCFTLEGFENCCEEVGSWWAAVF